MKNDNLIILYIVLFVCHVETSGKNYKNHHSSTHCSTGHAILLVQMFTLLLHLLLLFSAVILGVGKLSLEPVLGWEEAVSGEHRDQPHDL